MQGGLNPRKLGARERERGRESCSIQVDLKAGKVGLYKLEREREGGLASGIPQESWKAD